MILAQIYMLTEINTELFDIRGLNTDTDTKIKTSSLFCHIYLFIFCHIQDQWCKVSFTISC